MTRARRRILGSVVCLVLTTLTACSSLIERQPSPDRSYYAFTAPESGAAPSDSPSSRVLRVAAVRVDPPFDGRALQFRVGPDRFDPDYYNQWSDAPAALLTAAVRDACSASGSFAAVVGESSMAAHTVALELTITALYVDETRSGGPVATLQGRAVVLDAAGTVIVARRVEAEADSGSGSAASAVEGWNAALADLLAQIMAEVIPAGDG